MMHFCFTEGILSYVISVVKCYVKSIEFHMNDIIEFYYSYMIVVYCLRIITWEI